MWQNTYLLESNLWDSLFPPDTQKQNLITASLNSVTCKALHFKASSSSAEQMITAGLHTSYFLSCLMITLRMAVISPSVKKILVIPVFNQMYLFSSELGLKETIVSNNILLEAS